MNAKECVSVAITKTNVRISIENASFNVPVSVSLSPHEAESLARLLNSAASDAIATQPDDPVGAEVKP